MALKEIAVGLCMIASAVPISAAKHDVPPGPAPAGTPETLYCMRIEAITGSRLEELKCWTRAEWAANGVDVDKDWAKEGVRVIG